MRNLSRSSAVAMAMAVALAATSLALAVSARASHARSEARLHAAQARATQACRAFRAQPGQTDARVCRYDDFGPLTVDVSRAAEAEVAQAKVSLAAGDPRAAERALLAATRHVRELDHAGTVGALFAAGVLERMLAVVDAHQADLEPRVLAAILDVDLQAAARPFESWRVHELWNMARYRDDPLDDSPALAPRELADAIERDEAAYTAMEQATARGDTEACKRAARTTDPRWFGPDFQEGLCTRMAKVVATGKRVATARAAARARTAYVPPLSRSIDAELMQ